LFCGDNQFNADALNALFSGLSTQSDRYIWIEDNPGRFTCDRSLATEKGWTFK
jgi:hypothetical protein